MEEAARKFARRILTIHLVLLLGVVGVIFFASREVYFKTKEQAVEQAKNRQALLASQTARGIEAFYHSIFNDLDLLRMADKDENDETAPPTTAPSIGPRIDWKSLLTLGTAAPTPNPVANAGGQVIANAGQAAAFRTFFAGVLWKQLDGRISHLFGVDRDKVTDKFIERALEKPNDRPTREPRPGGFDRANNPIQMMGSSELRLHPREIVARSAEWLKSVEKPQISKFQQYDVGGETIGLNLVCVPSGDKNPRVLVAAVPIRLAESRFTDKLNTDGDSTNAILADETGVIMTASHRELVGRNLSSLQDPTLRALTEGYMSRPRRGVEVIETEHVLAGQKLPPAMVAIEPVGIAGKKWMFMVTTPLSDIDAVVNRVFKRAIFWAFFVVCSMTAILVSTAIQLIRARVRTERVRNDVLTKELTQAREIQLAWLPQQGVSFPAMDIAAINHPASHISGDFYNWFELPDGRTVVTIGDVTGHGLSAAFLMATTQLLVHSTMLRVQDPGKTLQEVNKQLCIQVFNGQFVTMLVCVIDIENSTLEVATAGHYPPILGHDGKFQSLDVEPQLVLGVEKDVRYPTESFVLPQSASLILYTDGVIDAQSPTGERFDEQRLIDSVKDENESAQTLVDKIVARINSFRDTRTLPDDLTLVCIQTQSEPSYRQSEAAAV